MASRELAQWRFFPLYIPKGDGPVGIAVARDGTAYATRFRDGLIYRVSSDGIVAPFQAVGFFPEYLTVSSRGLLYASGYTARTGDALVEVFTLAGKLVQTVHFDPSPSGDSFGYTILAPDSDGNVWLCEAYHVASITPSGLVNEYRAKFVGNYPNGIASIAVSPRRMIWFTIRGNLGTGGYVAKVDPKTRRVTPYRIPFAACLETNGMAFGSDGALYVACFTPGTTALFARITEDGHMTPISYPPGFETIVDDLVEGRDGLVYFGSQNLTLMSYDPRTKTFASHRPPIPAIAGVTRGPDGAIWGNGGYGVDRFIP